MKRNIETEFYYKGYECAIVSLEADPAILLFQKGCPERYCCGYVKVPSEHPIYRKKYYDIDIQCYGGLTYSEEDVIGINSKGWWIGFDCAHIEDVYNPKDLDFVIQECKNIVDQLREM